MAQLVEHSVYTGKVKGSNPLLLIMKKFKHLETKNTLIKYSNGSFNFKKWSFFSKILKTEIDINNSKIWSQFFKKYDYNNTINKKKITAY